jgi:hypothetical protein
MGIININNMCITGQIDKLNKLKKKGYSFEYDKSAINYASFNGYIFILIWFKNLDLKLKYNDTAIKYCYIFKKTFFKWFKNNNYKTSSKYIKHYKH